MPSSSFLLSMASFRGIEARPGLLGKGAGYKGVRGGPLPSFKV